MKSTNEILLWFIRQLQTGKTYCLTWFPFFKHKDKNALLVFEALSQLTDQERNDLYIVLKEGL